MHTHIRICIQGYLPVGGYGIFSRPGNVDKPDMHLPGDSDYLDSMKVLR
jgi:hypothetical protein